MKNNLLLFSCLLITLISCESRQITIIYENNSYLTDTVNITTVIGDEIYGSYNVVRKDLPNWISREITFPTGSDSLVLYFNCNTLNISDTCVVYWKQVKGKTIIVSVEEYTLTPEYHGIQESHIKRINCEIVATD